MAALEPMSAPPDEPRTIKEEELHLQRDRKPTKRLARQGARMKAARQISCLQHKWADRHAGADLIAVLERTALASKNRRSGRTARELNNG